jgi:hypothetical protein
MVSSLFFRNVPAYDIIKSIFGTFREKPEQKYYKILLKRQFKLILIGKPINKFLK